MSSAAGFTAHAITFRYGQRHDQEVQAAQQIARRMRVAQHVVCAIDLRQFGTVPHSGFGLGIERTVTWICGIHHIRETIPFPRTIKRVYP